MCLLVTLNQWKQLNLQFYSAPAIGISWVSSVGHIWCFHGRAPSGLRMEIYYWSQNYATHWQDAYDLSQLLPNIDCDLLCSPNYSYDKKRSEIRCVWFVCFCQLCEHTVHRKKNNSAITLYLDDMLGFFGDIMFQQACLINSQRKSKLFVQSDKMLCCKNEYTLLKVKKYIYIFLIV